MKYSNRAHGLAFQNGQAQLGGFPFGKASASSAQPKVRWVQVDDYLMVPNEERGFGHTHATRCDL